MTLSYKLSAVTTLSGVVTMIPMYAVQGKGATGKEGRPNIVYIMSDDHSYRTISAYGSRISQCAPTPNLDRLAASGMIFNRAYVENSISAPSRATLLTGTYSHFHGQMILAKACFDPEQAMFPALLQDTGYQTSIFGKWHLQFEPRGFDTFKLLHGQGTYYNPEFRTKGQSEYVTEQGYASEIITSDAINWLENRDKDRPFCLMVHHKSVHRNWLPEMKYLDLYDDVTFPEPETLFDDYSTRTEAAHLQEMDILTSMSIVGDNKVYQLTKNADNPFNREYSRLNSEDRQKLIRAYEAENEAMIAAHLQGEDLLRWKYQRYIKDYTRCVKSMDDQIGRLLDYLEKEGLLENTIIVYTSDQGFYMGEHGWFDKRFMYEESFRTPLIISWTGHIKPGTVCSELVQNIDYAPTFLDLAGVEIPESMLGCSLRPLFKNGKGGRDWRDDLYYHYYDYPSIHNVRRHDGVVTDRYKLIHFKDNGGGKQGKDVPVDSWELYDLKKDPSELHNVYGNPAYAKIEAMMKERLAAKRTELDVDRYEDMHYKMLDKKRGVKMTDTK